MRLTKLTEELQEKIVQFLRAGEPGIFFRTLTDRTLRMLLMADSMIFWGQRES